MMGIKTISTAWRFLLVLVVLVGSFGATRLSAQIDGSRWRSIGPAPIAGLFGESTGRASVLAVNPSNGDQVFLGTATGGVWFTPDRGVRWYPLSDDQPALAIGAILLEDCALSNSSRQSSSDFQTTILSTRMSSMV
jgi:hypothetical protein